MLEWLVISNEDVGILKMWGSEEFIDKVMAEEGKDVLLFKDNQVLTYIVVSVPIIMSRNSDKNSVLEIQATYPLLIMASLSTGVLSLRIVFLNRRGCNHVGASRQFNFSTGSPESDLCESIESQKEETSKTARRLNWFWLVFQLLI